MVHTVEYTGRLTSSPTSQVIRPLVPLEACVEAWGAPEELSDWLSPATRTRTVAKKSSRFKSFPPYLMIHARRFYLGYASVVGKTACFRHPNVDVNRFLYLRVLSINT